MTERNDSKAQLALEDGLDIKTKTANGGNRMLFAVSLLLLLAALGLLIALIIVSSEKGKKSTELSECIHQMEQTCDTAHCVKTAAAVIESMNTDVDPCEDFYEYSCGGWTKSHTIPEDQSSFSSFSVLRENLQVKLKDLFEKPKSKSESASITMVKDYYASCIDVDAIEEKDARPLTDVLENLGGWPVLGNQPGGNWIQANYDFEELWARLTAYDHYILIAAYVGTKPKDSLTRVLVVDQPLLGMDSRDYFLDAQKYGKEKQAYLTYMNDVAKLLGGDPTTVEQEMNDVLDFETKIANLTVASTDRRDIELIYNLFSLQQLETDVPEISFRRFFDMVLPPSDVIDNEEPIVNYSPEYIRKASKLIAATPPRTVANYMLWLFVKSLIPDVSQRFRDVELRYNKILKGTSSQTARWRECVESINDAMKFATGRMYVAETFSGASKKDTQKMIDGLKASFKGFLESNEWMDATTKRVAAEKIDSIQIQIGYPDWIMNDNELDEKYAHVTFTANDYFSNVLEKMRHSASEWLTPLRKKVDKTEWTTGPAIVNAYYSTTKNLIIFPAGILQPPFYHADSPAYLNYGGIGMVIGHEITHGFDDRGRQYDKDGNFVHWWTNSSVNNFKKRAQCIIDQYGGYVMPENNMNLNGKLTQGENIADNGGLKQAFQAYHTLVDSSQETMKSLPGINLTSEQLLFINFAQVWCSLYRPEGVTERILTGNHSPGRFRVIGTLHNNENFARVFGCPANSYMNSKNKCIIW